LKYKYNKTLPTAAAIFLSKTRHLNDWKADPPIIGKDRLYMQTEVYWSHKVKWS
jgi:hypothetical protein